MRVVSRVSLGNVDTRESALRETLNNLTLLHIHEARVNIGRVHWPIERVSNHAVSWLLACLQGLLFECFIFKLCLN